MQVSHDETGFLAHNSTVSVQLLCLLYSQEKLSPKPSLAKWLKVEHQGLTASLHLLALWASASPLCTLVSSSERDDNRTGLIDSAMGSHARTYSELGFTGRPQGIISKCS